MLGRDINNILYEFREDFSEEEVRNIIRKVIESLNSLSHITRNGERVKIVHRDFHAGNIMIHFPCLKPTQEQLEDPVHFFN